MTLRKDADIIIKEAIQRVLPDEAVAQALKEAKFKNGTNGFALILQESLPTFSIISAGEVKPQSAITPLTFGGNGKFSA